VDEEHIFAASGEGELVERVRRGLGGVRLWDLRLGIGFIYVEGEAIV
jgi:hypothetical protein